MLFTSNVSGYESTYDTETGIYQVIDGVAVVKESKSFDAILKFISTGGEKKEKASRLNIPIIFRRYNEFKKAVITSLAEKAGHSKVRYVWVVMGGKRSKESITLCYEDTRENQCRITEIGQLQTQLIRIQTSMDTIRGTLVPVTLDEKGDK